MGVEIGDLEGNLDSTRSGIIYQSETVSKIKFEKPNNFDVRVDSKHAYYWAMQVKTEINHIL
jgi:hypothetical protein